MNPQQTLQFAPFNDVPHPACGDTPVLHGPSARKPLRFVLADDYPVVLNGQIAAQLNRSEIIISHQKRTAMDKLGLGHGGGLVEFARF